MTNRFLGTSLIALLFLLPDATAPAHAQAKKASIDKKVDQIEVKKIGAVSETIGKAPWNNAYELQTDHFIVHIDIPEKEGIEVARKLEYLLLVMADVFQLDMSKWKGKKNCYLFNDINKFREVRDRIKGPQQAVHGYATDSMLICYVRGRGYGNLYWTYLHEGCHLNFNAIFGSQRYNSNYWAIEGIACYMGSLKTKPDGSFAFGEEDHKMLKKAYEGYGSKIAEMISWGYDQFVFRSDRGTYYVVGYGACHYFFNAEGGKHKTKFGQYIKLVHSGQAKPGSFKEVTGMEPSQAQEAIVKHVSQIP
ncbi:MAG: hypothetical protein A2Z34_01995 [Planctomycetes bacterium RBG_16_59_8]|nr:MAG: hypothetical protein A2Z34_01995 [Planctomycetes bacterium RBG_16_59_8]